MPFSSDSVNTVVGKPRSIYQCNHVVNEILNQNKKIGGLAKDYLSYGMVTQMPSEGVVVVGNDGVHVGIFVRPTEFVHSSSSRSMVVRVPLSQLPYVFPNGYQFRKE